MRCAILAILGGCNIPPVVEVTGQLAMTGVPGGDWTITPTTCTNHGDLAAPDAVATDGIGSVVILAPLDQPPSFAISAEWDHDGKERDAQLAASDCSLFDISLTEGQRASRHRSYVLTTGHLDVDCTWAAGGRVAGSLELLSCEL